MKELWAVLFTALVGLVVYYWQEQIKRDSAVRQRRQELYEVILRNIFELIVSSTGEGRSKFLSEIEKRWLFASDDVLRASYAYLSLYDDVEQTGEHLLEKARTDDATRKQLENAFARIFLAMRRDVRRTKIDSAWANAHVELYPWGIINPSEQIGLKADLAAASASARKDVTTAGLA
jgi:hypothetical protein